MEPDQDRELVAAIPWDKYVVEKVALNDLTPAPYNARRISDIMFVNLVESIRTLGFIVPIVINQDSTIIGGHQRVKAAREVGLIHIPAIRLNLDKEKEKSLNLGLNKINGENDTELEQALLRGMSMEAAARAGYNNREIGQAMKVAAERKTMGESEEPEELKKCPTCGKKR